MLNLEKSINALLAERQHLLNQLDAVDQALAALRGTAPLSAAPLEAPAVQPTAVDVTRVPPKRVLSDEHKRKLSEGRQKARRAKDVSKGAAREPLDGVPATAARVSGAPRLVKRTASRKSTVEPDADTQSDSREEVTH